MKKLILILVLFSGASFVAGFSADKHTWEERTAFTQGVGFGAWYADNKWRYKNGLPLKPLNDPELKAEWDEVIDLMKIPSKYTKWQ